MRTITRLGAAILGLAAGVSTWHLSLPEAGATPVQVRPEVRVYAAAAEQIDLSRWAVRRFEAAGLEAPAVEIHFHGDADGCGGHLGYAKGGRVDVCTTLVNAMTRRNLLHEMGHIWLDQNVTESTRARFLQLQGLVSWNTGSVPWRERGYEQGAEIIAWALGERILTPSIPDVEPERLEAAFELLTGSAMPAAGVPG